jgi:CRP-like cAMP-binding protein
MMNQLLTQKGALSGLSRSEAPPAAFAAEEWEELEDSAASQAYPPATELFQQGAPAHEVYFITGGLVKLTRLEPDGQEVIIGLRASGWLLGAAAVIVEQPHAVTVVAVTRCQVRRLSARTFRERVKTDAQFSWWIQQMQSREIYDQTVRVAQLSCISARHRLEHLLWQLMTAAEPVATPRGVRLQVPLKHWEIAQLIAVTPPYLSQLLNRLEEEGVLRREKGWFMIADPRRLWHAAESERAGFNQPGQTGRWAIEN